MLHYILAGHGDRVREQFPCPARKRSTQTYHVLRFAKQASDVHKPCDRYDHRVYYGDPRLNIGELLSLGQSVGILLYFQQK